MLRPVHFEIHADDLERAMNFYRAVFGWEFKKWEGPVDYWTITTGAKSEPGIDGGLIKRMGGNGDRVIAYVCTMEVPNLDEYIKKAAAHGGSLALAKMPIPGMAWLAYCKDTEGNVFGMIQNDKDAR